MSDSYHAQEGAKIPRLTYSIAKILLAQSPLHAWYAHPLLGAKQRKPTKAMDTGSICHGLMLGGGNAVDILSFDSYRTKEAQFARDNAYTENRIPVLEKDYQVCKEITDSATEQLSSLLPDFFTPHESEYPLVWTADNGIECQSKYDWINLSTGLQIDLKFTGDASPDVCSRQIYNMGYDLQASFYSEAYRRTYPEMAGREKWLNIFIETAEPYAVSIVEMDATFRELGDYKMNKALTTWKECLNADEWPAYGYSRVSAPGWAMSQIMGEE